MRMFFPKIRNKVARSKLIFKFIMIKVNTIPKPIVNPGDLQENIY
jgi:hypothetical protein